MCVDSCIYIFIYTSVYYICIYIYIYELYLLRVGEVLQNICGEKEVGIGSDKDQILCSTINN